MADAQSSLTIADWVGMSSLIITAFAVSFAAFEFHSREKWKQKQSLAEFMDLFIKKKENRSALNILDWDGGWIDLFPEYLDKDFKFDGVEVKKFTYIKYKDVLNALTIDENKLKNISPRDFRIREIIDYLLSDIGRLNLFIKNGLYKQDDVIPFVLYYANLISGKDPYINNAPHILQLKKYILYFNWIEARSFIERIHPDSFSGVEV